jgi:hypothetical protein
VLENLKTKGNQINLDREPKKEVVSLLSSPLLCISSSSSFSFAALHVPAVFSIKLKVN